MIIHYSKNLKEKSRKLRKEGTFAEALLWNELKGRKTKGYQFTRQKPIGPFIVDFYCSKLKLVIEVDGLTHIEKEEYDIKRQNYLESMGLKLLRFFDNDVRQNMEGVIAAIYDWIDMNVKCDNPPTPLS
jgi:very-short-patch-repair endonuclease